jgi:hypothetical protein
MPLWQAAPRGEAAAGALGGATTGLPGAGSGCADAADENASAAAIVAIATRIANQRAGINVTGSPANLLTAEYPKSA